MSGNELPKVIDKSQADIDAAIAAIKECGLPSGTKDFAISCIRLAVWLPKALLGHKIKLSNLRKLIFGFGPRNKESSKNYDVQSNAKNEVKNNVTDINTSDENRAALDTTKQLLSPGHGRLPHSVYKNTIEHQILVSDLKCDFTSSNVNVFCCIILH